MVENKTRLQRKREKESLKQAVKYLFLILVLLFLIVKFGLPGLVKMSGFIGNISQSKAPIEKQDVVPPLAPRFNLIQEATNSSELNISGSGEAGSMVQLYINGISAEETVVNKDGEFRFENVHLRDGESEIYAVSKDDQGNTSHESATQKIVLDQTAPELTVEQPDNGKRFFDKDSPIIVSGKSETEANLTINGRFVLIKSDDSFSTQLSLTEGDNKIEITARDSAGNETKKTVTVNYTP